MEAIFWLTANVLHVAQPMLNIIVKTFLIIELNGCGFWGKLFNLHSFEILIRLKKIDAEGLDLAASLLLVPQTVLAAAAALVLRLFDLKITRP